MACSLTVPDDFPASWALKACQQAGGFLGNDIYREILPRLILHKEDECDPTIVSLLGILTSCALNGFSLFFLLVLLYPQSMAPGHSSRLIWYVLIVGLTVFIPSTLGVLYYSLGSAGMFTNQEDTPMWSYLAFAGSMSMYATLIFTFLGGLVAWMWSNDVGLMMITVLILLLMPIAKTLLPVFVLLLGPGSIPLLSGKSFFEFCTT